MRYTFKYIYSLLCSLPLAMAKKAHRGPQGGQFFPGSPGLRRADGQGGMAPGAQRDGHLSGHKDLPDQLPSASDGDAGGPGA